MHTPDSFDQEPPVQNSTSEVKKYPAFLLFIILTVFLGFLVTLYLWKSAEQHSTNTLTQPEFLISNSAQKYEDPATGYAFSYPGSYVLHANARLQGISLGLGTTEKSALDIVVISDTDDLTSWWNSVGAEFFSYYFSRSANDEDLFVFSEVPVSTTDKPKTTISVVKKIYHGAQETNPVASIRFLPVSDHYLAIISYPTSSEVDVQGIVESIHETATSAVPAQKRRFDPNIPMISLGMYQNQPGLSASWPEELLSIEESELVGVTCAKYFMAHTALSFSQETQQFIAQNYLHLTIRDMVSEYLQATELVELAICSTSDEISYISVGSGYSGKDISFSLIPKAYAAGGSGTDTHFFTYSSESKQLHKFGYIPVGEFAYWSCQRILQITSSGYLYVLCGGGDGGGPSNQSVYRINSINKSVQKIYSCTISQVNQKPQLHCK